jgi:hypothetical protein
MDAAVSLCVSVSVQGYAAGAAGLRGSPHHALKSPLLLCGLCGWGLCGCACGSQALGRVARCTRCGKPSFETFV